MADNAPIRETSEITKRHLRWLGIITAIAVLLIADFFLALSGIDTFPLVTLLKVRPLGEAAQGHAIAALAGILGGAITFWTFFYNLRHKQLSLAETNKKDREIAEKDRMQRAIEETARIELQASLQRADIEERVKADGKRAAWEQIQSETSRQNDLFDRAVAKIQSSSLAEQADSVMILSTLATSQLNSISLDGESQSILSDYRRFDDCFARLTFLCGLSISAAIRSTVESELIRLLSFARSELPRSQQRYALGQVLSLQSRAVADFRQALQQVPDRWSMTKDQFVRHRRFQEANQPFTAILPSRYGDHFTVSELLVPDRFLASPSTSIPLDSSPQKDDPEVLWAQVYLAGVVIVSSFTLLKSCIEFQNETSTDGKAEALPVFTLPASINSTVWYSLGFVSDWIVEFCTSESTFITCSFDSINIDLSNLDNMTFVNCHFSGCVIGANTRITVGHRFTDCTFSDCEVTGDWASLDIIDCRFLRCRFSNLIVGLSRFCDLTFESCEFDGVMLNATLVDELKLAAISRFDCEAIGCSIGRCSEDSMSAFAVYDGLSLRPLTSSDGLTLQPFKSRLHSVGFKLFSTQVRSNRDIDLRTARLFARTGKRRIVRK